MNKLFWKKVFIIGVPVAIQNLINTLVNMVDTFMIGSLGDDYVSAVGLANKVFFVVNLLVFGIASGCSVLLSQYYGKKDEENLNKTFGFMMVLVLAGSFIFFLLALLIPEGCMKCFTNSETLISLGAPYLRIVSASYILMGFTLASASYLRSINKARAPMIFAFLSVATNVLCNYIFIFGKLGLPAMNANGAAIGTIIARSIEAGCMLLYLIFGKSDVKLKISKMIRIDKDTVKKNLKFAIPVIINEFGWGLGMTMYSVIYGHMTDAVVAATTIATALEDLVYALLYGVSTACAVIVGNQLGANQLKEAEKTAKKLLIAGIGMSVLLALLLVALIKPYLSFYDTTEEVEDYVWGLCVIYACLMPLKTFNLISIVGILRSGGDTLFCMLLELIILWAWGIPMGCLGAFAFHLDVKWVFLMLESEQIVKVTIGFIRYRQKKWVRNIVNTGI